MPILEMKVPSPGESISEVEIAAWLVSDGDYVFKDQAIAEVDSDKATLELPAEMAGIITLKAEEGDAVAVGAVVCLIDTEAEVPADAAPPAADPGPTKKATAPAPVSVAVSAFAQESTGHAAGHPSPAARKLMDENGLRVGQVAGTGPGGRVLKEDVMAALVAGIPEPQLPGAGWSGSREARREKMSMLRRKVAERLVGVKNETAMLTTFNEVDMKPIMDLRKKYKEQFKERHGVGLGFMGFFTKAVTSALELYPAVNAMIDGKEMVMHDYADIGIAVSSPKGLMVPVVRNAESMSLDQIEAEIKRLAIRAREGQITVDEMTGGTFTITNGGIFGSLISTPILNPPQTAILGMHKIQERPMAVNGKVEILPMMYLALSYDHRMIDGKEAVQFLVAIKEMLEDPARILLDV